MSDTYSFCSGESPLLISIPHDGRELAPGMSERMTEVGLELPDTDWHVRKLYGFAGEIEASVLAAKFSRYVVDLNRPPTDAALYEGQVSTGLCPSATFAGLGIYKPNESCGPDEQRMRVETYWKPYHNKLSQALSSLREKHGYALLWDAHSIRSEIPHLFQGVLSDLNLGTNGGVSCDSGLENPVFRVAQQSNYSAVLNGRFTGGYITRTYGSPSRGIHAVQLELAQHVYMDENSYSYDEVAATKLSRTIRQMVQAFIDEARRI